MNDILRELKNLSSNERELFYLLMKKEGLDFASLPITRRDSSGPVPLSYSQSRFWISEQLAARRSSPTPFSNCIAFRLFGALDLGALKKSFEKIVERHEVLKSAYPEGVEEPIQIVSNQTTPFTVIDLTHLTGGEREAAVNRFLVEESTRQFDLASGPVLRSSLLRLSLNESVLVLTTHNIVADGQSVAILLNDLSSFYQAYRNGRTAELPDLPIQYADYAIWQRQCVSRDQLSGQLGYWKERLRGCPSRLSLVENSCRDTYQGATKRFAFSPELSSEIRCLARDRGLTTFMVLLAGYQTLLHKHSQQKDVAVGTVVSNRNRAEVEHLVGSFANNLFLRTDFSGTPSFTQILERVRETAVSAFSNQDLPYEMLVEEMYSDPSIGKPPELQAMFVLHNSAPGDNLRLVDVKHEPMNIDRGLSDFDLSCRIADSEHCFIGSIEYATELFSPNTIDALLDGFINLLEQIIRNPSVPVSEIRVRDLPRNQPSHRRAFSCQSQSLPTRAGYTAPRSELERLIIDTWHHILKTDEIGIDDNFFDLGGRSIQIVQLHGKLRGLLGRDIPVVSIFAHPTVKAFAQYLSAEETSVPDLEIDKERASLRRAARMRRSQIVQNVREGIRGE